MDFAIIKAANIDVDGNAEKRYNKHRWPFLTVGDNPTGQSKCTDRRVGCSYAAVNLFPTSCNECSERQRYYANDQRKHLEISHNYHPAFVSHSSGAALPTVYPLR